MFIIQTWYCVTILYGIIRYYMVLYDIIFYEATSKYVALAARSRELIPEMSSVVVVVSVVGGAVVEVWRNF